MNGDIRRSPARRQDRKATTARARSGAAVPARRRAPEREARPRAAPGPAARAARAPRRAPPQAPPRSSATAARGSQPQGYAPNPELFGLRPNNSGFSDALLRVDDAGRAAAAADRLGGRDHAPLAAELDPGGGADLAVARGRGELVAAAAGQRLAFGRVDERLLGLGRARVALDRAGERDRPEQRLVQVDAVDDRLQDRAGDRRAAGRPEREVGLAVLLDDRRRHRAARALGAIRAVRVRQRVV